MTSLSGALPNVHYRSVLAELPDSRSELWQGLQQPQKTVDPKWFYDATGSALFEQITQLPEYYPTRTEIGILHANKEAISAHCGSHCVLIEPGAGSCEKARLLLADLRPAAYMPIDISADFLQQAATQLGQDYPWLPIHAVCADFKDNRGIADDLPSGKRVVFYPGSTLGNLEPNAAAHFLRQVRQLVGTDGGLLLGVDLHKPTAVLNAAYNDAAGVTARFNLNVLQQLNRVLDADFDHQHFTHRAFYNETERRIEMHLVSTVAQRIRCNGGHLHIAAGESIQTENSYKYTVAGVAQLAQATGFRIERSWLDDGNLFSVHYLSAVSG